MLTFIGLGLFDEKDISVKGLEAVRSADVVYAEFYTSRLMGAAKEKLEDFYGRQITLLSREDVEVDCHWLKEAQDKRVAFLVGGDPMASTTHLDLRLRALKLGIATKVIHCASIVTAASGLCGLQNYRFGRSSTIPFPYISRGKRIVVDSPYQVLSENLHRNLHTMLFLDIQNERHMTVSEGAGLLLEMQENSGDNILESAIGVGIARAGSDDAYVHADLLCKLAAMDFGSPLHILVVPARLHFMEAEALVLLANAPESIMQSAD